MVNALSTHSLPWMNVFQYFRFVVQFVAESVKERFVYHLLSYREYLSYNITLYEKALDQPFLQGSHQCSGNREKFFAEYGQKSAKVREYNFCYRINRKMISP